MINDEMQDWDEEKLRRKSNQHSEMASLAYSDGDVADAKRHQKIVQEIHKELSRRM